MRSSGQLARGVNGEPGSAGAEASPEAAASWDQEHEPVAGGSLRLPSKALALGSSSLVGGRIVQLLYGKQAESCFYGLWPTCPLSWLRGRGAGTCLAASCGSSPEPVGSGIAQFSFAAHVRKPITQRGAIRYQQPRNRPRLAPRALQLPGRAFRDSGRRRFPS